MNASAQTIPSAGVPGGGTRENPAPTPPGAGRIREIDAVRGLAVLLSMLYHYTGRFGEIYGHPSALWLVVPQGYGSELFFTISGYVTAMSASMQAERLGPSVPPLAWARAGWKFLLARLCRLYPAFVVAAITTFTIVRIVRLPGREAGVRDAIANLTMFPGHLGFRQIDKAYWSLEVQMIFFAIAAGLVAFRVPRALPIVLAGLVGLHLAGVPVSDQYGLFLIGAVFFESSRAWRWWHLPAAALGLVDLCRTGSVTHLALMVGVVLVVFAASRRALPGLCNPVLMFLGGISYGVYLVHQNLGYVIIRAGYRRGWDGNLCVAAAIAGSVALAAAVTYLVERPANRWLRGRFGLSRPDRAAVTFHGSPSSRVPAPQPSPENIP